MKTFIVATALVMGWAGCHLILPYEPGDTTDAETSADGGPGHDGEAGIPEAGADAKTGPPLYRLVSKDGWGVRRPLFRDGSTYQAVRGIWVGSVDNIWLIGEDGWIVRKTASGWRPVISPTTQTLRGVWGASSTAIWVVGDKGTLLRFDGAAVRSVPSGLTEDLLAVGGSSAAGVWIGGRGGAVLGRVPGGSWTPYPTGKSTDHHDVLATPGGVVWVSRHSAIQRRSGNDWVVEPIPGSNNSVTSLWGAGERPVWAGDAGGKIYSFASGTWTTSHTLSAASGRVYAFWGDGSGDMWAAGTAGVYRHDGAAWSTHHSDPQRHYYDLWGVGGDLYAAASGGNLMRRDGKLDRWYRTSFASRSYITAISGGAGEVWIIGGGTNAGRAYRNAGKGLELIPQEKNMSASLRGVWVSPGGAAWLVGEQGTALRYNPGSGQLESAAPTNVTATLRGVWGAGDKVWASGDDGTVLRFQGGAWTQESSGTTTDLLDIWGSSESDVWAVGWAGKIIHRTGGGWKDWGPKPTTADLHCLFGRGAADVWAVGSGGTVLRFGGATWSKQTTPATGTLKSVWVSKGGKVWIGSDSKALHHYSGSAWSRPALGAPAPVSAIWGRSETDIWIGSTDGTVQHFDDRL